MVAIVVMVVLFQLFYGLLMIIFSSNSIQN